MPAVLLSAGLGLRVGLEVWRLARGRPGHMRKALSRGLRVFLFLVLPALLAATLVEVFVTPLFLTILNP